MKVIISIKHWLLEPTSKPLLLRYKKWPMHKSILLGTDKQNPFPT